MKRSFLIAFAILLICSYSLRAGNIEVKSRCKNGSITLRWAPTDYNAWKLGNTYGYNVERYTIMVDGVIPSPIPMQRITSNPVKVTPREDWLEHSDDLMVALAAECIFDTTIVAKTAFEVYNQYSKNKQRFSFALFAADMSPLAASLSGLSIEDNEVKPNEKYLYRVFMAVPDSIKSDTASTFINAGMDSELPVIGKPTFDSQDKSVTIFWDTRYLTNYYTSYIVERTTDNGVSFNRCSETSMVQFSTDVYSSNQMAFSDTLPDNTTTYGYRVIGISCFGEYGQPSEVVYAHGAKHLTKAPIVIESNTINNNKVVLKWGYDDIDAVNGFKIYRRSGGKNRFKMIGETKQCEFTDNFPDISNYYKVAAYNGTGEVVSPFETFVQLIDSFPPMAPIGLNGDIDSLGVVTIKWRPNTENDLDGYRVYAGNLANEELALLTPDLLHDTMFKCKTTLNTLTREFYCAVQAVDLRNNHSEMSEVLTLLRPDTIAPPAPILQKPKEINSAAQLKWIKSYADDVDSYLVYRRVSDMGNDSCIAVVKAKAIEVDTMSYTDATVEYSVNYEYQVVATDFSKNKSYSNSWRSFSLKTPLPSAPKLKISNKISAVVVSVSVPKNIVGLTPSHILLFRAVDDGLLELYSRVEIGETYNDNKVKKGHIYRYAAKLVFTNGTESSMSNEVKTK